MNKGGTGGPRAERAAMIEVLRSIVDAPGDHLHANLQAIVDNAVRLCRTDKGFIYLRDGEVFRHEVQVGATPEVVEFNRAHPIHPDRGTSTGRAVVERKPIHIPNVHEDPEYEYWEAQRLGGFQSLLSVPMLHGEDVVGVVSVYRSEIDPFTDDEISLLATFAEQATLALVTSQLIETVARQKEELSRYMPPQVAELLSSPEGRRALEGHRSEITVVFVDLRGFTKFSALAEPEEVISVLGDYHEEMGRHVTKHNGTLGGFEGDGLMIFFNDPVPMPGHAGTAVAMAREMQSAFVRLAQRWEQRGFLLGLGIGIATGYVTLGRIGYEGRYDYSPIGTTVNLAARLCDEAGPGMILASQRTVAAGDLEASLLSEPMALKGIPGPVPVYEV